MRAQISLRQASQVAQEDKVGAFYDVEVGDDIEPDRSVDQGAMSYNAIV